MVDANHPTFTAPAQRIWERTPQPIQRMLLDNVWCAACRKVTTMIQYSGQVKEDDLLLTGRCTTCGKKVARLVEAE